MRVVAIGFTNSGANEIEVSPNQAFNLSILLSRRRYVNEICRRRSICCFVFLWLDGEMTFTSHEYEERDGSLTATFIFKTRNWGVILRWLLVFFDSARRCLGVERLRANVQEKAFKAKGMRCG